MKKYLLPETGNFYKANLHCHTKITDGCLTPDTMKGAYMAKGYSIIAYTDHDILVDQTHLSDKNFLALNGQEVEIYETLTEEEAKLRERRTCHVCMIALDPDNHKTVCDEDEFVRTYDADCVNRMIKEGVDNGFFVTYNHPYSSFETAVEYRNYHGMHAMEICNGAGQLYRNTGHAPQVYDDMLRGGERIFCVAGDDNHNYPVMSGPHNDSFLAFTMIKAENLEYKTVTNALLAGHFYASQAPEIKELWYEDGKINIVTSPVKKIILSTGKRRVQFVNSVTSTVSKATFDVMPTDIYVRISIQDAEGKFANTNAYFVDELLEDN